ncbi:MAG: S-layer-like domain-containing protein [Parcubacteria group bacterium Athens1014_10]|nr:MAG: S-layer-like domain-containing protein [Parcubacteria group bacterium Athens1014_10]TSD06117.1 MAG: S-layer-like domain-containing protein [Parcubacteria group bacterium Athens0714_12]
MFEEKRQSYPFSADNPQKNEPEDIFSNTEKFGVKPVAEKQKDIFDFKDEKSPIWKKLITIVIGFLIVTGAVCGSYLAYLKLSEVFKNRKEKSTIETEKINQQKVKIPLLSKDSDADGLSDQEEIGLGTSIYKIDTDGDGLSDREEARVYNINPLNPDSDGDGFLDGQEVRSGYDPNNPAKGAKLLDLNAEIEKLK